MAPSPSSRVRNSRSRRPPGCCRPACRRTASCSITSSRTRRRYRVIASQAGPSRRRARRDSARDLRRRLDRDRASRCRESLPCDGVGGVESLVVGCRRIEPAPGVERDGDAFRLPPSPKIRGSDRSAWNRSSICGRSSAVGDFLMTQTRSPSGRRYGVSSESIGGPLGWLGRVQERSSRRVGRWVLHRVEDVVGGWGGVDSGWELCRLRGGSGRWRSLCRDVPSRWVELEGARGDSCSGLPGCGCGGDRVLEARYLPLRWRGSGRIMARDGSGGVGCGGLG